MIDSKLKAKNCNHMNHVVVLLSFLFSIFGRSAEISYRSYETPTAISLVVSCISVFSPWFTWIILNVSACWSLLRTPLNNKSRLSPRLLPICHKNKEHKPYYYPYWQNLNSLYFFSRILYNFQWENLVFLRGPWARAFVWANTQTSIDLGVSKRRR